MLGTQLSHMEEFAFFAPPISLSEDSHPVVMGELSSFNQDGIRFHSPFYFQTGQADKAKFVSASSRYSREESKKWLCAQGATPFRQVFELPEQAQHDFLDAGYSLQRKIAEGVLKKGVPYSFRQAQRAPDLKERAGILLAALEQQEKTGGFVCGYWDRSGGVIVLTPEVLFKRTGRIVETAALAGTKLKSYSSMGKPDEKVMLENWLNDPKERAEHDWVVKGIFESLNKHGDVKINPTCIRESGTLLHLETKIHVSNVNSNSDQLLNDLHPTPALGAFPRSPGREWLLAEDKKLPRSKYGAPFGIYSPDEQMELYLVAIRGIEWSINDSFCRMGAGAGVVEKSQMDLEWEEVENKWRSIAKSMHLLLSKEMP